MIAPKKHTADARALDSAIRRAYPTRIFHELDVEVADEHLAVSRLTTLLDAVASVPGVSAVLEPEVVKSHILHLGVDTAPDWEALNRRLPPQERLAAVASSDDGLLYWNILVSRFGPFWTGYWNRFRRRKDRVVPEVSEEGSTPEWEIIKAQVPVILASFGLQEVPRRLLESRVPWLDAREAHGTAHQKDGAGPSIYDALFSDVY